MTSLFQTTRSKRVSPRLQVDYAPVEEAFVPDLGAMKTILRRHEPLPPYTGVFGICEDGLPLLVDFQNPTPGSILVTADQQMATDQLLHGVLASTIYLNSRREVSVDILTTRPHNYYAYAHKAQICGLADDHNLFQFEAINRLVQYINQPGDLADRNAVSLLIVDDLHGLVSMMDLTMRGRFAQLIKDGPTFQVWVLAGFPLERSYELDDILIRSFGTTLIGATQSYAMASYFLGDYAREATKLTPGNEYLINLAGELMRFSIPTR